MPDHKQKVEALQSSINMAQALAIQLEVIGQDVNAQHVMMVKADLEFELLEVFEDHGPIVERTHGKENLPSQNLY